MLTDSQNELVRIEFEAVKQKIQFTKDYEQQGKDAVKRCAGEIKYHKAMRRHLDKGKFSCKMVDERIRELRNTVNMIEERRRSQKKALKKHYDYLRIWEVLIPVGE